MDIGSVASSVAAGGYGNSLVGLLKSANEMQGELVEQLIAATVETTLQVQSMQTVGSVLDVYA